MLVTPKRLFRQHRSKTEVAARHVHVRFTPETGLGSRVYEYTPLERRARLISPHPTWLATYPRSFSERPVFERRPCGDHCSAAACSTGRTASLAGRNTETTARLAALSMTERRSNPPSATARSARTLGVGHHTVDRDLGRENAGANAPTRLQTPSEAARAAGAHAPSGPTGTQAAKLVERRETGKAERQHLGLRGVPALSVTRREAAGSAPG